MNSIAVFLTQSVSTKPARFGWLAPVVVAFPVVCFSLLLLAYSVNVPWMDDIDAFLTFILGYTDAPTSSSKIDWLLRPNNEHRILSAKLITVALYNLTGEVNFRWLILIAFSFLLGILHLFYRIFRSTSLPLLAFAPVPFLLLQPQHYLTSIWAITALQHQVVVFLTFASIYLLSGKGRNRFIGATGLQLLASLSMSNGLFGWVAGAVVLALQRHWLRLALWLGIGVATISFYFHDFQSPQGNEGSFSFFVKYPYLVFSAFFTFCGALFDFFPNKTIFWRSILPTLAGLVLMSITLRLLWQMNKSLIRWPGSSSGKLKSASIALQKRRYFFTGCYTFLLVNAVTIAFLRPRFGYSVMLVSNYMLYPALLAVLLYLNALSEETSKQIMNRLVQIGLVVSLMVWSIWYVVRWPKVAYRKESLLASAFNQQHNNIGLGATWGTPFATLASEAMNKTVKRGMYHYPTVYSTTYKQFLRPDIPTLGVDPTLTMQVNNNYVTETTEGALLPFSGPSAVLVQSDKQSYLFSSEIPYFLHAFWYNSPTTIIRAEVFNGILAPGTYRVGVLVSRNIRFSNRQITIP